MPKTGPKRAICKNVHLQRDTPGLVDSSQELESSNEDQQRYAFSFPFNSVPYAPKLGNVESRKVLANLCGSAAAYCVATYVQHPTADISWDLGFFGLRLLIEGARTGGEDSGFKSSRVASWVLL